MARTALDGAIRRVALCLLAGLLAAWLLSEGAFLILRDGSDHAPQRIELVIPAGTGARVAAGEPPPSIPAELVFVVGDTLVIRNEDVVSHQLGPFWVPPGSSGSLELQQANQYSYACTFTPGRYLGLDVRPRVTLRTRLLAIALAGPPMGVLLALYSFVLFPLSRRDAHHTAALST